MDFIIFLVYTLIAYFIFDRICIQLEKFGYLYYKYKKPNTESGQILEQINMFFSPSTRHQIEITQKQESIKHDPYLFDPKMIISQKKSPKNLKRD